MPEGWEPGAGGFTALKRLMQRKTGAPLHVENVTMIHRDMMAATLFLLPRNVCPVVAPLSSAMAS